MSKRTFSPDASAAGDVLPPPSAPREGPRPSVTVDGKFLSVNGERFFVRGVTYGTFAADAGGDLFPPDDVAARDFALMRAAGVNTIRTYTAPPDRILRLAAEHGIWVIVGVYWEGRVCFLDEPGAGEAAGEAVRRAAEQGSRHPNVLMYCVGNEVSPLVTRWHGAERVESFLRGLYAQAKAGDPDRPVTYASYPPTEYLDTSVFDVVTFNVYLTDEAAFRAYLGRLQSLAGGRPLLLGEFGRDSLRDGEATQAESLAWMLAAVREKGLCGGTAYAWTDDWVVNGHPITDWRFGVVDADRSLKPAYGVLRDAYLRGAMTAAAATVSGASPSSACPAWPRISVVVASYNGGRTIAAAVESLLCQDYADFEIIVVDDGSRTPLSVPLAPYLSRITLLTTHNRGLSAARNLGIARATGAIVAYTDDDCRADPQWLYFLACRFREDASLAAVGGPNLLPAEDPLVARAVDRALGCPTHVLSGDEVAEHIPGCNMAFRKEALEAIGGFDGMFRAAGDDVDVCWRLLERGYNIGFHHAAVVWHHRRATLRGYLRQQRGYGVAEADLEIKHPEKFNHLGYADWGGGIYEGTLPGPQVGRHIFRGRFADALFQRVYPRTLPIWIYVPLMFEWYLATAALLGVGSARVLLGSGHGAGLLALAGFGLGATLAACAALTWGAAQQARRAPAGGAPTPWTLVALMNFLQPLVRGWGRSRRVRWLRDRGAAAAATAAQGEALFWSGGWSHVTYLEEVLSLLRRKGSRVDVEEGWHPWDATIRHGALAAARLYTVQQYDGKLRCRAVLRPTALSAAFWLTPLLVLMAALVWNPHNAAYVVPLLVFPVAAQRARGVLMTLVAKTLHTVADRMGMAPAPEAAPAGPPGRPGAAPAAAPLPATVHGTLASDREWRPQQQPLPSPSRRRQPHGGTNGA